MEPALEPALETGGMNDFSSDRESLRPEKEQERHVVDGETPTCRICRGDEGADEPLFHPCKCSGSIRFVHQACLMEWLSRSGKRHCELCKTSFRFTKLYDPRMPASIPVPVFLQHAVLQAVSAVLRIMRWALVLFIWLAWVPWTMRLMWRFLFWLADGAWIEHPFHYKFGLPGSLGTVSFTAYSRAGVANATVNSVTSLTAPMSNITSTVLRPGLFKLFSHHVSKTLWDGVAVGNGTASLQQRPFMLRLGLQLLKGILPLTSRKESEPSSNLTEVLYGSFPQPHRQTLLSEVSYLKNFTRWSFVNRTITDILEGQLITVFVIVFLIVVFLIREWVVQQQPGGNAARDPAPIPLDPAPAPPPAQPEEQPEAAGEGEGVNDGEGREAVDVAPFNGGTVEAEFIPHLEIEEDTDAQVLHQSISSQREYHHFSHEELRLADYHIRTDTRDAEDQDPQKSSTKRPDYLMSVPDSTWSIAVNAPDSPAASEIGEALPYQRPQMPSRNAFDKASRLHRVLEEERSKVAGDRWPGIANFMDYWNRGNCDPQSVLDLIHEEGREIELSWIVNAMKRLQRSEGAEASDLTDDVSGPKHDLDNISDLHASSHGSWQVVEASSEPPGSNRDSHSVPSPGAPNISQPAVATAAATSDAGPSRPDEVLGSNDGRQGVAPDFDDRVIRVPEAALDLQVTHDHSYSQAPLNLEQQSADDNATLLPATEVSATLAPLPRSRSTWEKISDYMWGGIEMSDNDQEQIAVQLRPLLQPEMEHEAPQAPQNQRDIPADAVEPIAMVPVPAPVAADPEVLQAARDAGIEPEDPAIEDGEDLDGLMELVGLEGPFSALLQHAIVCAALVSLVVFLGIWIPYILGKVMLVVVSNPLTLLVKLPLRWVFFVFEVLLDASIFLLGLSFYWLDRVVRLTVSPVGFVIPYFSKLQSTVIPDAAQQFSNRALRRLLSDFALSGDGLADSDIPYFSIIAHETLVNAKGIVHGGALSAHHHMCKALENHKILTLTLTAGRMVVTSLPGWVVAEIRWEISIISKLVKTFTSGFLANPLKLQLDFPERSAPLDLSLIHWSALDRFLAIAIGYLALYVAGSAYTKLVQAISKPDDQQSETVEIIQQARGVLKVIFIIGIEMIAFPLYCGILLDIAMLPLFGGASALSRLTFTAQSPWTSLFLHWFVGTCYMFHFALFVSMCRKQMRKGVLYFIRDPDDETFHPVRDVLERNLGGQLRKIGFSALVYGALILICLGAVVWAISGATLHVLPIRWTVANPAIELPMDLCVYNLLVPVAVKLANPSKTLTGLYKWWFRRCARMLRLSHFLFGDRREDEEGYWDPPDSKSTSALQSNGRLDITQEQEATEQSDSEENVEMASGPKPASNLSTEPMDLDPSEPPPVKREQNEKRQFIRSGRFVRAPASDRVRIPRGQQTFLSVDEMDNRLDGKPEVKEGLHVKGDPHFELVFLPPRFQTRIAMFAILIWGFAAVTGLAATLLPLVVGRALVSRLLPIGIQISDVHSFVLGAYLLGIPAYLLYRYREPIATAAKTAASLLRRSGGNTSVTRIGLQRFSGFCLQSLRLLYFYGFICAVLPTLLSMAFWLYVAIPLCTITSTEPPYPSTASSISLIQSWVLGVLFMRVAGRIAQNNQDSRFTRAVYATVANNNDNLNANPNANPNGRRARWLDPDVRLATRALIMPSLVAMGIALGLPLGLGALAKVAWFGDEMQSTLVHRYSYPAVAAAGLLVWTLRLVHSGFMRWRSRIRDEVYLVGERLHNFGEGRRPRLGNGRIVSAI